MNQNANSSRQSLLILPMLRKTGINLLNPRIEFKKEKKMENDLNSSQNTKSKKIMRNKKSSVEIKTTNSDAGEKNVTIKNNNDPIFMDKNTISDKTIPHSANEAKNTSSCVGLPKSVSLASFSSKKDPQIIVEETPPSTVVAATPERETYSSIRRSTCSVASTLASVSNVSPLDHLRTLKMSSKTSGVSSCNDKTPSENMPSEPSAKEPNTCSTSSISLSTQDLEQKIASTNTTNTSISSSPSSSSLVNNDNQKAKEHKASKNETTENKQTRTVSPKIDSFPNVDATGSTDWTKLKQQESQTLYPLSFDDSITKSSINGHKQVSKVSTKTASNSISKSSTFRSNSSNRLNLDFNDPPLPKFGPFEFQSTYPNPGKHNRVTSIRIVKDFLQSEATEFSVLLPTNRWTNSEINLQSAGKIRSTNTKEFSRKSSNSSPNHANPKKENIFSAFPHHSTPNISTRSSFLSTTNDILKKEYSQSTPSKQANSNPNFGVTNLPLHRQDPLLFSSTPKNTNDKDSTIQKENSTFVSEAPHLFQTQTDPEYEYPLISPAPHLKTIFDIDSHAIEFVNTLTNKVESRVYVSELHYDSKNARKSVVFHVEENNESEDNNCKKNGIHESGTVDGDNEQGEGNKGAAGTHSISKCYEVIPEYNKNKAEIGGTCVMCKSFAKLKIAFRKKSRVENPFC